MPLPSKLPLDISRGIIAVDVYVAGPHDAKIVRLALDTGATFTMIPVETAISIGCDPLKSPRRIDFITPSGTEYAPLVTVASIKCLGVEVKNIEVACHNLPPKSPVEGLLGLNFLKHFNLSLKFLQKILEISNK